MSMVEWISEEKKDSLILFVHGLKGGMDTWDFDADISFPKLLALDEDISNVFDIACFNYFTKFTQTYAKTSGILARIFSGKNKIEKNLPTDEIAELLYTEIEINLDSYSRIIIVAHSMGGLISKNVILKKIEHEEDSKIIGFISLAVPHSGAILGNITSLVSSNAQLVDLKLLSNATDELNRKWLNCINNVPITRYIYGAHDSVVDKKSALPMDSERKNSFAVNESHSSICKPNNNQSTVFVAVKKFIHFINAQAPKKIFIERLTDEQQYNNEYFVLKMIVADIHQDITMHAKEYYYNAELIRNVFTSDHDQLILSHLYSKIREIYQEEYEQHIASSVSPDKFIATVHARISKEDKTSLSSLLKSLETVHKKGMLHQLANSNDKDIVWSSETNMDKLEKLRRGEYE
ncbi:ABC-three component system protein [Pantoea sp. CCBC3-3-1]|uniref:ABC-three component system protein n=1 Tax=Pantoea sp. CCBC3-3-1 TaxID=2490851 RepID=UPI0011BDEFC2|nr:ABC-three component system protein [Pantoea sp. CCBC3-3-1]